jgi:murein DD-endopeptidase MepM/ murein hydrolase activator NlpD
MTRLSEILKARKGSFAPVVDVDARAPGLVAMDFTAANTELSVELLSDTEAFSIWVEGYIRAHGGKMGIGGYAEHRTIYSVSQVFDAKQGQREPRRLHLGVDIWAPAGTAVHCPLEGRVHSFSDQDRNGDYGAVIILEHELDGVTFHTLYGHLSRTSLETVIGKVIAEGEVFAWLGAPGENGNWPPHLHFQLIEDIVPWVGDYPGVCPYSDRERWLANCPDPEFILDLQRFILKDEPSPNHP